MLFAVDGRESVHWMRYVRYARHEGEKNLVAIQYERNVYYKTVSSQQERVGGNLHDKSFLVMEIVLT